MTINCNLTDSDNQAFRLVDERIENDSPDYGMSDPYFFYKYQDGNPVVNVNKEERKLTRESVETDLSILVQRRDPDQYPETKNYTFGININF